MYFQSEYLTSALALSTIIPPPLKVNMLTNCKKELKILDFVKMEKKNTCKCRM